MINRIIHLFLMGWRSAFEIVLLTVVIRQHGATGARVAEADVFQRFSLSG